MRPRWPRRVHEVSGRMTGRKESKQTPEQEWLDTLNRYEGDKPGYRFASLCSKHRSSDRDPGCESCQSGHYYPEPNFATRFDPCSCPEGEGPNHAPGPGCPAYEHWRKHGTGIRQPLPPYPESGLPAPEQAVVQYAKDLERQHREQAERDAAESGF